jgi:hypothetical protein
MNQGRFSRFEQHIEQLVEGSFARLFAGRLHPREVATHLMRAMEDHTRTQPDGTQVAPNLYSISLNPADFDAVMAAHPDIIKVLSDTLVDLAYQTDARLLTAPILNLNPDDETPPRKIHVVASHQAASGRSTQMFPAVSVAPPGISSSRNPQLIIGGTQYVPLNRPVINIGRRHDNHIVIDDVRISRLHAQLRLRFGHYVLYDLGSSGGTYVNDHIISECILKPSDVISLAGVLVIYIEDEGSTGPTWATADTDIKRPTDRSDILDDSNNLDSTDRSEPQARTNSPPKEGSDNDPTL